MDTQTKTVKVKNIYVKLKGQKAWLIQEDELNEYVDRSIKKYGSKLHGIELEIPEEFDDMIDIRYDLNPVPFQRLRRITGYLVGDMSRWNNGKRAEEHDRVKHDLSNDETKNDVSADSVKE